MNRIIATTVAFVAVSSLPLAGAWAQEKHESNTIKKSAKKLQRAWKKASHATEYAVRKGGENTTLAVHRAEGKKTRVHDRGHKRDYIVKPNGKRIPVARKP